MILGVPTLYRYDLLRRLIESAAKSRLRPDTIFVIDNGGSFEPPPSKIPVNVLRPRQNLGVAASWNRIIAASFVSYDRVLISNDDVELGETTLSSMEESIFAGSPLVLAGSMCCFGITRDCVNRVGYFDEAFWPAYHEDHDYMRRVHLAGLRETYVPDPPKHEVSATLKGVSRSTVKFIHEGAVKNGIYYEQKWGGPWGNEKFTVPFDGGDRETFPVKKEA